MRNKWAHTGTSTPHPEHALSPVFLEGLDLRSKTFGLELFPNDIWGRIRKRIGEVIPYPFVWTLVSSSNRHDVRL